jgi:hypothetical protein
MEKKLRELSAVSYMANKPKLLASGPATFWFSALLKTNLDHPSQRWFSTLLETNLSSAGKKKPMGPIGFTYTA